MVNSIFIRKLYAVGLFGCVSAADRQDIGILEFGLPYSFSSKDDFRPSMGCMGVPSWHSAEVFLGRVAKFSDSIGMKHILAMRHIFKVLAGWVFSVSVYMVNLLSIWPCSYERSRHQDMNVYRLRFVLEAQNDCRISSATEPRLENSSSGLSPAISGRVVSGTPNSTDIGDFVKSLISRNLHRTPFFCWNHIRLLSESLLFNGRQRGKEIPAFAARRLGDQGTILT